jgi:branched-chain amino acid transport system permease protein
VISTLINLVIVIGLYVFIGNSGVVSFGQIGFMAFGAYATGLLTVAPGQKRFLLPHLPHSVAHLHLAAAPALVLVVAGMVVIAFGGSGVVAGAIALALMGVGGVLGVAAAFFEIGASEDRDRRAGRS